MDYVAIAARVSALISRVGVPASFIRSGTLLGTGSVVFVESKSKDIASSKLPAVSNTAGADKTCLCAGFNPLVGDRLTCNQGTFKVYEVEAVNPAGTALLYTLKVK